MKKRSEIEKKDTWNIEKIFSDEKEWKLAFDEIFGKETKFKDLLSFKNKLSESAKNIKDTLETYFKYSRKLEKLFTYAHLYLDQDVSNDKAKQLYGMITNLYNEFQTLTSFLEPEIIQIENSLLKKYLDDTCLKDYKFYLEKLLRLKKHTLSFKEEEILARSSKCLDSVGQSFSSFNNADVKFDSIEDSSGKKHTLSHATFLVYLRSSDRTLRKNAFKSLYKQYSSYENTITELLSGQIKNASFISESRKYKNSLQASLFPKNIDESVYLNLIEAVKKNISSLHKFVKVKKKKLKLDKFHFYDIYAPIVKDVDLKFDIDEAKDLVINSVRPLGEEYQKVLKKGLSEDRWLDVFETKGKRSGAYSSGCYDSYPYMLMNFEGNLNDVLTLAHECGHSMHSFLSDKNQSYQYSQYPIFLAEIASTFNEQLLIDHLLKKLSSEDQKKYLYNYLLDGIHATLFRQTLFAEFELKIHSFEKNNIPITPALMKKTYEELYRFYYGEDFEIDDCIKIEWARIPHFYSSFYVYQYAIGISTALYFFNKVKEDENFTSTYLDFLKSGGSDFPLNILKKTTADLTKATFIENAIKYFDEILDKFI